VNAKSLAEGSKKKSKYRVEYEKYQKIKDENQRLTDIMFNLRKELYLIEVINFTFINIFRSIIKKLLILKFIEYIKLGKVMMLSIIMKCNNSILI
jgi:hypothetical protein